ncbi:MAG TPA: LysR substrate-binding domain-containing protein [Bosea sp. (in: a-proteobacteria)]|jgi:DNA-binding transcriptional LysR family regulator|nr:LysR substrate-binding domain-containing protein [Bosea sp. (in: a-proteobacteria)]
MELRLLHDFLSIASTSSFSRSAEDRHVTQPAFSRRIRSLEAWVGTALVDRSTYPTTLTPAGHIFRSAAEDLLRRLETARRDMAALRGERADVVVIAALHSLSTAFVPEWLHWLEQRISSLHCRLLSENTLDAVDALSQGSVDLLLSFAHEDSAALLHPTRFPSILIGRDIALPVCRPDECGLPTERLPGCSEAPLRLLAYAPGSYLGRIVDEKIDAFRPRIHVERRYENSFTEGLKALAAAGHGCAWLPLRSVQKELETGQLVRAGGSEWDVALQIRLFRNGDGLRRGADAVWEHCRSAGEHWDELSRTMRHTA